MFNDSYFDLTNSFRDVPLASQAEVLITTEYPRVVLNYPLKRISVFNSKSEQKAIEHSNLCQDPTKRDESEKILEHIMKSVARCPEGDALALLYALRGKILNVIGDQTSALIDTNRAIKYFGNRSQYTAELERQKKKIIMEIKKSITQLKTTLEECDERDPEDQHTQKLIWETKRTLKTLNIKENATALNFKTRFNEPIVQFQKQNIPNVSCKIKVIKSIKMGRCIRANKEIAAGELLWTEKPYASALFPSFRLTHCSHCFIRTASLIGCDNCTRVMYCGDVCRQEALDLYHRIECKVLVLAKQISKTIDERRLLALRILLKATKRGRALEDLMNDAVYKNTVSRNFTEFVISSDPDEYYNIHTLQDYFTEESVLCCEQEARSACVLLHFLMYTSYFPLPNKTGKLRNNEIFAASLLLKYLLALRVNVTRVFENTVMKVLPEQFRLGEALYPLLHFVNHSCDPNITVYFQRNMAIVRAVRPIAANEQICIAYDGIHFAYKSLTDRRLYLESNYYFKCECTACKHDWPFLLRDSVVYYSDKIDEETLRANREKFESLTGICDNHLEFLYSYSTLLHENVTRPSLQHFQCEKRIEQLLKYYGNYYEDQKDTVINFDIISKNRRKINYPIF